MNNKQSNGVIVVSALMSLLCTIAIIIHLYSFTGTKFAFIIAPLMNIFEIIVAVTSYPLYAPYLRNQGALEELASSPYIPIFIFIIWLFILYGCTMLYAHLRKYKSVVSVDSVSSEPKMSPPKVFLLCLTSVIALNAFYFWAADDAYERQDLYRHKRTEMSFFRNISPHSQCNSAVCMGTQSDTAESGEVVTYKFIVPDDTVKARLLIQCPLDNVFAFITDTAGEQNQQICNQNIDLTTSQWDTIRVEFVNTTGSPVKIYTSLGVTTVEEPEYHDGMSLSVNINSTK